MNLSKVYNPKKVERKIYLFWQRSGFFNPDKLPKNYKKPYSLVIPPPNITGNLHMGHALNAVIQDILARQKRMLGFKTLWLPGIDHAGIASQNVVEKELRKKGISRFDLGREKFIKLMWEWKKKYGKTILEQLKKLGASLDWSRTKFTLSNDYSLAVKEAFFHYFKKGWIYQGKRVINWCKRCQTSLSDLELEYKKEKGKLWHLKYKVKSQKSKVKSQYITVATTRPETMFGDMAVAVNPKDKRYQKLIGKKLILPLLGREIPLISHHLVDPKFGTGAVKITPAHDLTDYRIALEKKLEIFPVIDKEGKMINVASPYLGLTTKTCRTKVIADLKKLGLLEKVEDYEVSIPKCYRCQTPIEFIPSEQWFLKMKKLAEMAKKAVKKGEIKFIPKNFEKIYFDWLENIKDWCLSRQIWWGHPLPVWLCQTGKGKSKISENWKLKMGNSSANTYLISLRKPKGCPFCGKCKMKQSPDVLDTWFSSALWPFATLGWPSECCQNQKYCKPKANSDLAKFYPTDVLSTDRGIINLWVARMIFSGLEFMKKIPFKIVYIHPTVLTKEGKRMSKSLGTGIDPKNLIEKYGADATRFGIAFQIMGGQDIKFVEDNIIMGKKFCNKIWNAARFVLLQIGKAKKNSQFQIPSSKLKVQNPTPADRKILKALDKTIKSVNKNLENFQFGQAAHKIYDFFWHDFCDRYIEEAKCQMSNVKCQKQTKKILLYILLSSLKILHPFCPFITEEIYQKLPIKNKKKCLMVEKWP